MHICKGTELRSHGPGYFLAFVTDIRSFTGKVLDTVSRITCHDRNWRSSEITRAYRTAREHQQQSVHLGP